MYEDENVIFGGRRGSRVRVEGVYYFWGYE